tara:strand:+ start:444 stop:560 length:117 start_codon:yes stop_codon:yes gene_type:complete
LNEYEKRAIKDANKKEKETAIAPPKKYRKGIKKVIVDP